MSITKKISCLSRNLIAYGVVFLSCRGIAYSQNFQVVDSSNAKSVFSSKTNQNKISYQKPSENFYKTDSIFSFRSQKGYFPSLLHNFAEQATASFHFKTKQLHQATNYKYAFVVKEDSPEGKQMGLGFDSLIVLDRIFQMKKIRLTGVIGSCPQSIVEKIEEIMQLMRKNSDL